MSTDPVVKRNGRSTSQVSIYDYPEHLNPFYEDENHKRLRFWKLGKKNGESRRGSFSMAGLKEMWAFKSFRLKKKSSSLGINKTSESPPPLRRSLEPSELNYGTYDPRMRQSTGMNGHFERNAPYRSSLQDMRNTQTIERNGYGGIGFVRNDMYRNTIQTPRSEASGLSPRVPARRYVYGGSITPQPSIRSNFSDDYSGISRGSSQLSVSSTNPFDEDDNEDVVLARMGTGDSQDSKQTPSKRPPRKKRRAPPPPVPVPKVIIEEASSSSATPSTSHENQNETRENIEITHLTAEIENFVKTTTNSSEDELIIKEVDNKVAPTNSVDIPVEVRATVVEKESPAPTQSKEISPENESQEQNNEDSPESHNSSEVSPEQISLEDNLEVDETMELRITSKDIRTSPVEEHNARNETQEDLVIADVSPDVREISKEEPDISNFELKITESKEDLSIISETSNETTVSNGGSRFQIRYVPLKDSSPETEPELRVSTRSNESIESNGVVTFERRRSVKEIIESINRSQSLLRVSQEQLAQSKVNHPVNNLNDPIIKAPPRKKHEAKENLAHNFEEIVQSESEINRMIDEMEKCVKIGENENIKEAEVDELIDKIADKLNNNENECDEIFKKCTTIKKEINRECSPTSSNLDWNPVPKPKRTKNLSPELTKAKVIREDLRHEDTT